MPAAPSRPLICTADDAYLDRAVQWCSAVGVTPEVAHDTGAALRAWREASFVVVGADHASVLARAGVHRRDRVYLLAGETTPAPWETAMALGAEDVLRWDETDKALQALTAAVDGRGEGCVISVVGGAGGAGASTVAAGLALACGRRGMKTLLVDADPLGGGLDLLMGIEHHDGVRWDAVTSRNGPMTARALAEVLPESEGVSTLSFGRDAVVPPPMANVVMAGTRGFEVVVVDVARQCDEWGSEALARSLLTVLVVPESVRGLGASKAVLGRIREHTSSVVAVAAARRPGLDRDTLADALGIPVVGRLRCDARLRTTIEHGAGPAGSGHLRRAIRPLLDLVAP
jgi:secretion/DNA translocation related CpaE-like protein